MDDTKLCVWWHSCCQHNGGHSCHQLKLLWWWWWWLLSGVSATWGAIPRALSYAGVLRLWKLYFNMKHSWWEVGFMLRFELVWDYWNVIEFLMLMKAEISITILIGFFNLEVNQYCETVTNALQWMHIQAPPCWKYFHTWRIIRDLC